MAPMTKAEIIAAIDARKRELTTLPVEAWGGEIIIRRMTAADFEATGIDQRDRAAMTRVVALSIVDENSERLFSDEEAEELGETDIETMAGVFAEVMRINGLLTGDVEEALAVFTKAQPDA